MSHINGQGYGSSHDWMYQGSIPKASGYQCKGCGERFTHMYDETPNIFQAIEQAGVPDACREGTTHV